MNTLHVHPRATELQIVTQGRMITAMTPENGVLNANGKGRRVITNEVKAYQMTPFYQGSVHTQFNPDCTDAVFVASFNAEDFGTGQVVDETFAFGNDIVAAAFGQSIDGADIDRVRAAIPASIAKGVEQCLKTCGIAKRTI
jgi:oxalate decarboxylase/phosphoglucose isomerase-like protein (cupin superfamily)